MAYFNQERKAKIAPEIKALLSKYNLKGSLSVQNHSTVVLTVKQGSIDFIENFIKTDKEKPYAKYMSDDQVKYIREKQSLDVNVYWYQEHFSGKAKKFLEEAMAILNKGNHDNSDAQVDYFDVGWYVDVNIGKWNQPYALTK
jgi:hypothetical protein